MEYYETEEFSKRMSISTETLHHYDEIGLLKPSCTTATGDRLYSNNDVLRLILIKSLEFTGFTLEEIQSIVINATDIRAALRAQTRLISEEARRLKHIKTLLTNMKNNKSNLSTEELFSIASEKIKKYEQSEKLHEKINKEIIENITNNFNALSKKELSSFDTLPTEKRAIIWFEFWAEHHERACLFPATLSAIQKQLSTAFSASYKEKMEMANKKLKELYNIHRTEKEQKDLIDKFKKLAEFHIESMGSLKIKENIH